MRSFDGRVWDVVTEEVDLGEGGVVHRDFVQHTGAVAHPRARRGASGSCWCSSTGTRSGAFEWELPAGLLDVDGEPAHLTAAARAARGGRPRAAGEWHLLLDHYASPGGSSEALRVFLARDLHDVPEDERHERDGEELGMPVRRVPLDEVVEAALAGDVHNGTLMIAVLAASRLRDRGWAGLRSVDEPWPTRSRGRSAADPGGSAG